ncbi:MAG: rhomboid family intramembrane serine protease [Acidobacteria bacterium]|nr:rhomboid family intramembrane serine protease [Acidobacteriota bacterium]
MSDSPIIISNRSPELRVPLRRRWEFATLFILVVNVLIFLLMELAGGSKNPDVLLNFGASYGPYFRRGEYWRAVMPMFLHIGVLHLLVNTYALFLLGRILERVHGYGRFALIYVGCGIGSSLLSMTLSSHVAAGASGAIFGIAGAMVATGFLHRESVSPRWARAFGTGIIPFIVLNLILGYSISGIDNWGHLGGLASGLLLGALVRPPGVDWIPGAVVEEPSQAAAIIPVVVVALAMGATADHYRMSREVARLLEESTRLRAAGHDDRALERIQDAMRVLPHDERPHEQLGQYYLEQERADDAIREYEEAARLSPASPRAQLGLALAYRQKGDLAKSRQIFESLVGKSPRTAEGWRVLADLYAEQKLYAEAIEHYQQALRKDPNDAITHNNLAWLLATSEDLKFRDPPKALEHARRAVELSGGKEAAFVDTLAEAHFVNGNFAEAVRVQTRALELDPDNPELREHMERYRKAAGV